MVRKERLALKKNKKKDFHLIPKENCQWLFNIMLHFNYIAYIKYTHFYTRSTQKKKKFTQPTETLRFKFSTLWQ